MKSVTALLCDDSAHSRGMLKTVLGQYGIEHVFEVSNGEDLLKRLASTRVDLILLDINMPEMSGLETLQRIRESGNDVYVVIISGNADAESVRTAVSLGARGYVVKPFTTSKVFSALDGFKATRQ